MMNIPFYSNTKDDLHCLQACLRMVLGYWLPSSQFSFRQLDKITGSRPDQWTWDTRSLVWLTKNNFNIIKLTPFDYKKFVKNGKEYLRWLWHPDVYARQDEMSNLTREQKLAKKLVGNRRVKFITKSPTLADLDNLLKQNYVIIANINPRVLDDKEGYSSHSVVIVDTDRKDIIFHDPGLPAEEKRRSSKSKFKKALKEIVAVKSTKN